MLLNINVFVCFFIFFVSLVVSGTLCGACWGPMYGLFVPLLLGGNVFIPF